jgi:hypothetical protein
LALEGRLEESGRELERLELDAERKYCADARG